jgi:hypothetical protein
LKTNEKPNSKTSCKVGSTKGKQHGKVDSKETYHPTQGFVHHVLIAAKMQKKLYSPGIEGIIGVERVRITANTENVDDKFPGTR